MYTTKWLTEKPTHKIRYTQKLPLISHQSCDFTSVMLTFILNSFQSYTSLRGITVQSFTEFKIWTRDRVTLSVYPQLPKEKKKKKKESQNTHEENIDHEQTGEEIKHSRDPPLITGRLRSLTDCFSSSGPLQLSVRSRRTIGKSVYFNFFRPSFFF